MTDPLTTSIAAAVATGATAALSDGVKELVTRLGTVVRDRFRRSPSDEDTLAGATRTPDDPTAVRHLAELLDRRMRDDPDLAQRLRALWAEITAAGGVTNTITNTVSGPVHGSVVQARDVQGGITFRG